jgi:hypothetical protein
MHIYQFYDANKGKKLSNLHIYWLLYIFVGECSFSLLFQNDLHFKELFGVNILFSCFTKKARRKLLLFYFY